MIESVNCTYPQKRSYLTFVVLGDHDSRAYASSLDASELDQRFKTDQTWLKRSINYHSS